MDNCVTYIKLLKWIIVFNVISLQVYSQGGKYDLGARSAGLATASVTISDSWSMFNNIAKFHPIEDDREYRLTTDTENDLKWQVIGEVSSPDKKALMFGLTRNRTESESFRIVGDETETNKCPGIDHLTAFPAEVLLMINDDNKLVVQTARQMIRMDMYFWDAGMAAFMDHMGMPGMLDESIYRALFAKDKE